MNSQIQFETNGMRVLVVPVQEDVVPSFAMSDRITFNYWYENSGMWMPDYIMLPEGNWKYHCTTDAMTEEQAEVLCVSYLETEYTDYSGPYEYIVYENGNDTAKDELFEILRSHGINPNEKHVILIEDK